MQDKEEDRDRRSLVEEEVREMKEEQMELRIKRVSESCKKEKPKSSEILKHLEELKQGVTKGDCKESHNLFKSSILTDVDYQKRAFV